MPDINAMLVLIFLIITSLGGFFAGSRRRITTSDAPDTWGFEPKEPQKAEPKPKELTDPEVFEGTLSFFEQAHTSRQLLRILATSEDRLSYKDLTESLNEYLRRKNKNTLPEHAVRNVVMILMGANLVRMKDGDLSATAIGKRLWDIVKTRQS